MTSNPALLVFADPDLAWSRPLRAELRRRGARTQTALNAAELEALLAHGAPDLVVLSDRFEKLPAPGGPRYVRARCPGTLVLTVGSTTADSEAGIRTIDAQPDDALQILPTLLELLPGRLATASEDIRKPALIMCVDDDPRFLRSLERMLRRHGYRVACFTDPERALESIWELRPELAIVDIMMPGMNGLNLAEEIREACGGRVPIVLVSALDQDQDIVEGYRHGACYYITKPCEPSVLYNVVDYLAGGLDSRERKLLEANL